jgi:hypothetical protein
MEHEAVLTVLRPTGPKVDSLIELMAGLVAKEIRTAGQDIQQPQEETPNEPPSEPEDVDVQYYLTSVASDDTCTAEECIKKLLGAGIFAASENLKRKVKPGDWICFYATATGVVAHARVKSPPVQKHHPLVKHPEKYPYVFEVDSVTIYTENPVVLSAELRAKLNAFQGRDPSKPWAWLVLGTQRVTKHDFMLLTRQAKVEVV